MGTLDCATWKRATQYSGDSIAAAVGTGASDDDDDDDDGATDDRDGGVCGEIIGLQSLEDDDDDVAAVALGLPK